MQQVKITLTQKERNKANITRYREKDPVKYNTLICEAKKRYYEKNQARLIENCRVYREKKKVELDFLKSFYDQNKLTSEIHSE